MSDELMKRAQAARIAAAAECRRSANLRKRFTAAGNETVVLHTSISDHHPLMAARQVRLKRVGSSVGRDAVIEEAKDALRVQYGLNGEEAFDLLVGISQRTNRKLRLVAESLIATGVRDRRG